VSDSGELDAGRVVVRVNRVFQVVATEQKLTETFTVSHTFTQLSDGTNS